LTFRKVYIYSQNIYRPKTVKNVTAYPALQPVFKVHRQNHGVCIDATTVYWIISFTMRCRNAVHLWNKICCCNSSRM